jgi:hypothetical protein
VGAAEVGDFSVLGQSTSEDGLERYSVALPVGVTSKDILFSFIRNATRVIGESKPDVGSSGKESGPDRQSEYKTRRRAEDCLRQTLTSLLVKATVAPRPTADISRVSRFIRVACYEVIEHFNRMRSYQEVESESIIDRLTMRFGRSRLRIMQILARGLPLAYLYRYVCAQLV